jgi:hypothetical protein
LHNDLHFPLEPKTRKDIGMRRQNIFTRQNSEAVFKSISGFNSDMEVMDTVIGHSVVKSHTAQQQQHHQRVLCLDGGGMKVISDFCLIMPVACFSYSSTIPNMEAVLCWC